MEMSGPVYYNSALFLDQSSYNCQGYAGRFTMPWMQRCEKLTNLVFGKRKENVFCMKFIQNTNELTSMQCFLVMMLFHYCNLIQTFRYVNEICIFLRELISIRNEG